MSSSEKSLLAGVPTGLFIGGVWRDSSDGATVKVEDPATGEVLTEVADASVADGRAALDAAVAAQPGWAATAPRERGEILRSAFEAVIGAGGGLRVVDDVGDGQAVGGVPR